MDELLYAIKNRIKSPYFGYAILAFVALNWRGVFLLAVSEADPVTRLEAFDSETSYFTLIVFPLIIGAIVAASTHWLRYLFLLIAKIPLELIENSHLEAEHKKAIFRSELEQVRAELTATREQELIERAKRDESIAKISDESKKRELEEEIGKIRRERDINLSDTASELLKAVAFNGNGMIMKPKTLGDQSIHVGKKAFGIGSKRDYAAYESALDELIESGYVKDVGLKGEVFELTHEGWKLTDALTQS